MSACTHVNVSQKLLGLLLILLLQRATHIFGDTSGCTHTCIRYTGTYLLIEIYARLFCTEIYARLFCTHAYAYLFLFIYLYLTVFYL
jgi:hypothetical protein